MREVILGESGVLSGCKAGSVIVDMTTSEPSLAAEIYQEAKRKNVHSLDAPVSGERYILVSPLPCGTHPPSLSGTCRWRCGRKRGPPFDNGRWRTVCAAGHKTTTRSDGEKYPIHGWS